MPMFNSWIKAHKAIAVVVFVAVAAALYLIIINFNSTSSPGTNQLPASDQQQQSDTDAEAYLSLEEIMKLPSEDVKLRGVLICQRMKEGSAVPDQGCPTGLKVDNGKSYDLRQDPASGPPLLRNKPFGEPVEITGKLYQAQTRYQADGIIVLQSVEVVQ